MTPLHRLLGHGRRAGVLVLVGLFVARVFVTSLFVASLYACTDLLEPPRASAFTEGEDLDDTSTRIDGHREVVSVAPGLRDLAPSWSYPIDSRVRLERSPHAGPMHNRAPPGTAVLS